MAARKARTKAPKLRAELVKVDPRTGCDEWGTRWGIGPTWIVTSAPGDAYQAYEIVKCKSAAEAKRIVSAIVLEKLAMPLPPAPDGSALNLNLVETAWSLLSQCSDLEDDTLRETVDVMVGDDPDDPRAPSRSSVKAAVEYAACALLEARGG